MYKQFKVLGFIMARGGSKGVPRKNIRLLMGKPLVGYTIESAKGSKYIDRLIISTDDQEIADVAKFFGAEVPFLRPKELAQDTTRDFPVFQHALEWLRNKENYKPDFIVHLKPTYPFRKSAEIDKAIEMLAANPKADSVWTVARTSDPPYKMFHIEEDGFLKPVITVQGEKEAYNWGRQQLPKTYLHRGQVDVARYETVMQKNSISGENILSYPLEGEVVDINEPIDWEIAENLMSKGKLGN